MVLMDSWERKTGDLELEGLKMMGVDVGRQLSDWSRGGEGHHIIRCRRKLGDVNPEEEGIRSLLCTALPCCPSINSLKLFVSDYT